MILRRLGTPPQQRDDACVGCNNCPDVFELVDGDFAVIGTDVTEDLKSLLPRDAGCGENEKIIRIPRSVLCSAWAEMSYEIGQQRL
jgi:hypothetical protein